MPFQQQPAMMMQQQPHAPVFQPVVPQQPQQPQRPAKLPSFTAAPLTPQPVKATQTPTNAELARQVQPSPFVRLQDPGPAPAPAPGGRLVMPPPEHFGLAMAVPQSALPPAPAQIETVDWNQVRGRLQKLGSVGFHCDKVAQGHRFIVYLPTPVEAIADTEPAAVQQALARAEAMARR